MILNRQSAPRCCLHPGRRDRPESLDPGDAVVTLRRSGAGARTATPWAGACSCRSRSGRVGRSARRDRGIGLEELHGFGRVGHHQQGLDPSLVEGGGVTQGEERVGEVGDGRVDPGDHRERCPDVEAPHPVVGRPGRLRELGLRGRLLAFGGRDRVGGDDHRLDQVGEPGPGQSSVGGFGHPLVDEGGLPRRSGHGSGGRRSGRARPGPPSPRPAATAAGTGAADPGRRPSAVPRRTTTAATGAPSSAGANSRTRGVPAPPSRTARSRPGSPACAGSRVDGVVEVRVPDRSLQDQDLGPPLGLVQQPDLVEELTPRQVLEPLHHPHEKSQPKATDSRRIPNRVFHNSPENGRTLHGPTCTRCPSR